MIAQFVAASSGRGKKLGAIQVFLADRLLLSDPGERLDVGPRLMRSVQSIGGAQSRLSSVTPWPSMIEKV